MFPHYARRAAMRNSRCADLVDINGFASRLEPRNGEISVHCVRLISVFTAVLVIAPLTGLIPTAQAQETTNTDWKCPFFDQPLQCGGKNTDGNWPCDS